MLIVALASFCAARAEAPRGPTWTADRAPSFRYRSGMSASLYVLDIRILTPVAGVRASRHA
jgi:hypothetical protein